MSNQAKNAGFLDGTDSWTIIGGGTLAVLDGSGGDLRGGPGRHVLRNVGNASAAAQARGIAPVAGGRSAAVAGEVFEAHGCAWGDVGQATLQLVFRDAGGSGLAFNALTRVQPAFVNPVTQTVSPRRGLPSTFDRFWGRFTAPANTATAEIRGNVVVPNNGQAYEFLMLKPHLEKVPSLNGPPRRWDPGPHTNADLNLPVWPDVLAPFQAGGEVEPIPNREAYVTRSGIPRPRKLYSRPRTQYRGRVRCDAVQADVLQAFYEAGYDAFYVVRPDTDQLCVAEWLVGGEPRTVETRGPTRIVEVGLLLDPA